MLYRLRCCNVTVATSNSELFHNADTMTSNLESKFTSQHIIKVLMATLIHRCIHNVKFPTFSRYRYCDVAPTLHLLFKECQMWTIHGHMVAHQSCEKSLQRHYICLVCRVDTLSSNSTHYFSVILEKIPKTCFQKICRY